ncbi:Rop family plasmid primer RNA-binding protein, partial [Klebsiella pneumoniae]|nr:Rop family plasmid primer RNA-binding protein [Klebsiella pneumoniae]MBL9676170.1 Rop family plasmid primer RNA-binding protein [Klebsiella pneumoniae]MBQ0557706.1 Rop family plasmid primer RNA-binding protein [Klebsiella pneumoniae]MBQ0573068.1 Rop family plasmid primer RNA-binding protein [Klebsiella pneumoniae]MCB7736925.1 Rop family plasmid primer RNA-binding protein [Klebsiella pneumoniae]
MTKQQKTALNMAKF